MAYHLEIKSEAKQDIIDGFLWYEEKKTGLGERFFHEVQNYLNYISQHPNHYQKRRKNYREAVLKVFPFVIIYELIESNIVVYSVFPSLANPNKKRN